MSISRQSISLQSISLQSISLQSIRVLRLFAVATLFAISVFGQGRCRDGYGTPKCPLSREAATAPIPPVFASTGWRTVAVDHITFELRNYRAEAAFYVAVMGWKLRSDDGRQAALDAGNSVSVVFRRSDEPRPARVVGLAFVIEPWNAASVENELRKRQLSPVSENDGKGFESFHVKDPDGIDIQVCNAGGLTKGRQAASGTRPASSLPFAATGWKTVWLDHLSYNASNYKRTASFYVSLLGWKPTYDEGSQHELLIGEAGNMIIRGPNPFDPAFGNTRPAAPNSRIDHISWGISPWDTDGVKAELLKRRLTARPDTSTADEIHVAAFKSYHTTTPNGYNLQISYLTHDTRLTLLNAVKPKALR